MVNRGAYQVHIPPEPDWDVVLGNNETCMTPTGISNTDQVRPQIQRPSDLPNAICQISDTGWSTSPANRFQTPKNMLEATFAATKLGVAYTTMIPSAHKLHCQHPVRLHRGPGACLATYLAAVAR